MPRLVLLEDDGTEIISGDISRANVGIFFRLLKRHQGAITTAAAALRIGRELLGIAAPPRRQIPRAAAGQGGGKKRGHA